MSITRRALMDVKTLYENERTLGTDRIEPNRVEYKYTYKVTTNSR